MLGFLGSIIGSGINYFTQQNAAASSERAVAMQNLGNMYLAKYQNDRNLELWNMQNEYNAPKQQMARLKEAGLNPNLVYGNGSAVNVANAPASTQVPHLGAYTNYAPYASGMASSINSVFDNLLKIANIRKTNQETSNLNEYQNNMKLQGSNLRIEIALKNMSLAKSKVERQYWERNFELEMMQRQADLNLSGEKFRNLTQDTTSKQMHNDVYQKYGSDQAEADLMNSYATYAVKQQQVNLMSAQIADHLASAGYKQAATSKVPYEIALLIANRVQSYNQGRLLYNKTEHEKVLTDIDKILEKSGINLREGGKYGFGKWIFGAALRFAGVDLK